MKIAVVGGGFFGITCAYKLGKKHTVDLYEKNADIMCASSDVNQSRIHRGYHYPRSDETVQEVLRAEKTFVNEFKDAVMKNTEKYYCIAKEGSLTTKTEYKKFCERNDLEYEVTDLDIIKEESIDLCVKVKEELFDHKKIKKICWEKLKENNVNVKLEKEFTKDMFEKYDFIVISTYADSNSLLEDFPTKQRDYQFEICEKAFVKLPDSFKDKSVLIMDGPFMSIDPVGETDYFIIGDVVRQIFSTNIGKTPIIDEQFLPLLNRGIIKNPPITNFKKMIQAASKFMPEINDAVHIGSSFCVKTVLSDSNETDKRPTLINYINKKIVSIFSGKISTCVEVSLEIEKIVDMLNIKN